MLRPGVDLYLGPGVILTMGRSTDAISDNALLDDLLDGTGARTNRIFGFGEIVISNTLGRLLWSTSGESKWNIEVKSARTIGQNPLLSLDAGGLIYSASDFSQADNYDVITTGNPAPQYCYFRSRRLYAGDSLIEMGRAWTNWGDGVFSFDYGECLSSGGAYGSGALCISGNSQVFAQSINFKRSSAGIYGTLTNQNDPGNGTLYGATIRSLPASTVSTVQRASSTFGTALRLSGCTLIGPTGFDPIEASPTAGNLTLENCTVIGGASSTNWVRPSAAGNCNVRVWGGITVNRTNHASVTVTGKTYTTNSSAEVSF